MIGLCHCPQYLFEQMLTYLHCLTNQLAGWVVLTFAMQAFQFESALQLPIVAPSGVAEPDDTDVGLMRKLTDALALIDVRVLDHFIIGQGVQTSLAERGLM